MVHIAAVGEWKFSIVVFGAPSVIMAGALRRPELYADSWDVAKQNQLKQMHNLEKVTSPSGWMISGAREQNLLLANAQQVSGEKTTAPTGKMLGLCAQVGS